MQLGISSYTFSWSVGIPDYMPETPMSVMELLDIAENLGVHLVQIADNMPLHRLSPSELGELSEKNIGIEVGTRGIANDNLRTYLKIADRLNSPILRVVVDTAEHHPSESEIVKIIKDILPDLKRTGITLAIENHDRFTSKSLARTIYRIDSEYVGICLDTANSFGSLERPDEVLETLGDLTVNLHLKDFIIHRASHNMGFIIEGRPAGQGMLDIPDILNGLCSRKRDVNVILELWTPPEDTIAATIEKEISWAEMSVQSLQKIISQV